MTQTRPPEGTASSSAPVIVAITGASGVCYGVRILDMLGALGVDRHVVVSKAGERTLREEMDLGLADIEARSEVLYPVRDIGATIASGSFKTAGMIVAPSSIRTASEIATGITSSLVTRAADVILKERRKLILMVRETPLHLGHLRTLTHLAEMGAIIAPSMPAFYTIPDSIDQMITQSAGRVLDLLGFEADGVSRWQGRTG